MRNRIPCQRDAGTRLATALRRRPFSACNKGNRRRLHAGNDETSATWIVCDSPDSLQDETYYLNNVFSKNNCNTDFVRRNTHSNTDSNTQTKLNSGPVTTATIHRRHLWIHRTYTTTLQYTCCTQTDNHFTTTTYKCQGQRQTGGQTGSSIQD